MITANFFPTLIKKQAPHLNYGISEIPVRDGMKPGSGTLGVADYLMSFKTTQHPDAVGKFIAFFYQNNYYEQFLINEGMLPVTQSAGADLSKGNAQTAYFIKLLPSAHFYPNNNPDILRAFQVIRQAGEAVLSNQASPTQALNEAQQQMTSGQ